MVQVNVTQTAGTSSNSNNKNAKNQQGNWNNSNWNNNNNNWNQNNNKGNAANSGRGGRGGRGDRGGRNWNNNNNRPQCQICGKLGHIVVYCYFRFDPQAQNLQHNSENSNILGMQIQVLPTTAPPDNSNLQHSTDYQGQEQVYIGYPSSSTQGNCN
ncbi:hypothetical protein PIB30_083204 [Stylosanthes scabra]|uniref:CCHC-type domain-containing protein n=1 Tax=Stylosanthes scabra TaxID=79078 RepID=A0ABU6VRD7_9FABA|nr:hypothetical protein [Stylosanthes scabra]